ncbi:MAG: FkbM family methyltransferase [bacterium]|nr:FkbM family methyltransferase [bacterium]
MLHKIKSILFSIFLKVYKFLLETRVKKIFDVKITDNFSYYEFLCQIICPNIAEIQGSKMYINIHDKAPIMRKTFLSYAVNRVHEESTTEIFKKVVKKGDVVVDLGANIGYFSLLAAKLVGKDGKVYSFEPEPKNYNYLVKNIDLNGYNNIFSLQKAISDKAGKIKLYICPYDTGHHTINQYKGIEAYKHDYCYEKKEFIEIETMPLDDFLSDKDFKADVIKMDVEGAEMLALLGMDRVIKENKNLKMFVEFFPLLIREMGNSPEEFILKLLKEYNFSIFVIERDYFGGNVIRDRKYLKINSVDEIMKLCKDEQDWIANLFLEKRI